MAGSPKRASQLRLLTMHEYDVFNHQADGLTVENSIRFWKTSKRIWYKWINETPERQEKYKDARRQYAHSLAEETLSIADGTIDPAEANISKMRIDTRKWLAGKIDPDSWGDKNHQAAITINIQDQHLEALRSLGDVIEHEEDEAVEMVEIAPEHAGSGVAQARREEES
jgi:hypothetical protein